MPDLGFLDGLGTGRNTETVALDNLEAVLFDFAFDFISQAQKNLDNTASVASGALSKSMKTKVKFAGNVYTLSISLADYYDFINKGVSGTEVSRNSPYSFKTTRPSKSMVDAIQGWLKQGNLKTTAKSIKTYGTYGKLEAKNKALAPANPRSIAYAVSTSIKKKGIKSTYFFDNAFQSTYPQLKKDLAKALKKDIQLVVRQINTE